MTAPSANAPVDVEPVKRYFRGEYSMVPDGPEYPRRDGAAYWVAEEDYAALLLQVAEQAAEIERLRTLAETNGRLFREADAAQSDAERAREECVKLAERWERISATHGIRCFTGDDHLIFANELRAVLGEPLPAAFLAANGGAAP